MAAKSRTEDQVRAALAAVEGEAATAGEKAEMLMEVAMGLQQKPQHRSDIEAAIGLYSKALEVCPNGAALLSARIRARLATALMALPAGGVEALQAADSHLETALATLAAEGVDEEIAEAEMNHGLVLQGLAGAGRGSIQSAISAYQRALRTFDKAKHPKEFAILQNNLATAFLSIPFAGETAKMREALAVQAFEDGLKVVSLVDHPNEYAMLQNNLGNALQTVASSHPVENGFRALEAYDEALKVRTREAAPDEYANTIANRANCLAGLPDDPADPARGNRKNLAEARELMREAAAIFAARGSTDKADMLNEAIAALEADLEAGGSDQKEQSWIQ